MQLGRDVIEPLLKLVSPQRVRFRGEASFWLAIGQVLKDGRSFGEHRPIVEMQSGHVPFRVDRAEVLAARSLASLCVNAIELEWDTQLAQHDVGRQ